MVQKVRDSLEKDRSPLLDAFIGDRSRQIGLTAAARTNQHQPPRRLSGEGPGCLAGFLKQLLIAAVPGNPVFHHIIEGAAGQSAQITVFVQPIFLFFFNSYHDAAAGYYLTVVGPS